TSTDPASAICGQELKIVGSGFGASREAVSGRVVINGTQVQTYIAWSSTEIRVVVPSSVTTGFDKPLDVETAGGTAQRLLPVSC
ncbi:MAG: IPT/TIG domain-containing protein, partial [Chloroflexi bacterium]|nr:IPT/TIG domain-containing protein [Chloroflexota bacterium]